MFLDPFCGTAAVARQARALGFSVVSGDVLAFSYVLQRTYLCCDGYPRFADLDLPGDADSAPSAPLAAVLCYLNAPPPVAGFIQQQYNTAPAAVVALALLVAGAHCRHLLLSYNSEGLIPEAAILAILAQRGAPVIFRQPYRRFRRQVATDGCPPQRAVSENLYYVYCAPQT